MSSRKWSRSNAADMPVVDKEWDEASCPICMEHPHNAVLLICSSHDNGCRSYICNTSYRHSNCLDRFRNLKAEGGDRPPSSADEILQTSSAVSLLETGHDETNGNSSDSKLKLKCPMCRGDVFGWKIVEEARKYLNMKPRNCSSESCSFMGNYSELRHHARRVHPTTRPADIDPTRQRAWRRLENQREYDDIVSAIHTAMPGAMVLGDYVIENGDGLSEERDQGPGGSGRWLSTFVLFQMIGSMDPMSEARGSRLRALSRHRRSSGSSSRRRFLWGENLLGLQEEDDDEDEDEGDIDLDDILDGTSGDIPLNSRRRRRLMRSRTDEDQQH